MVSQASNLPYRTFLLTAVAVISCAHGERFDSEQARAPAVIPLLWAGVGASDMRSVPLGSLDSFVGQSVAVIPGEDRRKDRTKVGDNVQDRSHPVPVSTRDDVVGFVTSQLGEVLLTNAVNVVPAGASRSIVVNVGDFYVEEENVYQGRVLLQVTVLDGAGRSLWTGIAIGTSNRWGRSFDPGNYQETLSNAALDAFMALLKLPGFQAAMTRAA